MLVTSQPQGPVSRTSTIVGVGVGVGGEEQALLAACRTMNAAEHKRVGPAMHDRVIGALETCCRQGEMLRIQNRHVDWPQHQIVIPGANAKDAENRRIPFDPKGRLAPTG